MVIKIILNYILGFVNITVEGFFVERFINNCISNKVFLWGTKRKNTTLLTTNVNINDFKKIRQIAKKTKCKVNINSKKGFPILLHKYRKRKLLLLLCIPVILVILISSRFIWNIEIVGADAINKDEIVSQLEEEGVSIGKLKSSIDSKKVINSIRVKRQDISWMSLDLKGTNVIVTLVEAEQKPNIINKDEYCNIVAGERGMITKITADTGTKLVKQGDIVEKGDLLIGGYMEGKFTDKRFVHAKGSVEAKVWYTKNIKSNYTREISEETGNKKDRYSINFNNFKINLYKTLPKFENYDTINEAKKIKLFKNFYLPIEINKTTYIEKKNKEITYGIEDLKDILINQLEKQFEQEGISNLNVVNKIANFYEKENNILELEMTYEVIQNIGIEEKIE